MNMRLHQRLSILKSKTYSQMDGHVTTPSRFHPPQISPRSSDNPDSIAERFAMYSHWNRDVEPAGMRRTAEITPQNTLHDFFIGAGSGVWDATVPAGAQDQT